MLFGGVKENMEMLKYKTRFHIPTVAYGFIETEVEDTPENTIALYHEYRNKYEASIQAKVEGIPNTEYNDWSNRYLLGEEMTSADLETYKEMNQEQQSHIQWAKRTLARLKSREAK